MRKVLFAVIAATILLATSCKKSSSTPNQWSFEGNTYPVTTCADHSGSLIGTCTSANSTLNGASVTVSFPGGADPTASGTYTVVNSYPTGNQVQISMTTGGVSQLVYNSTGSGNAQVTVKVATNGYVTMTGSGITLQNSNNVTDTSGLTLSLTQTQ